MRGQPGDPRNLGGTKERLGELFEQLCLLRRCYPLRSDYDARSVLSLDQAIAHGEHLMHMATIRDRRAGYRMPRQAA